MHPHRYNVIFNTSQINKLLEKKNNLIQECTLTGGEPEW